LSVLHYVNEYVPGNLQVNPNYFSDLPVAWKLYGGTAAGLDLNRPLTLPLTVNASQVVWWRATVPRDTPSGAYTLVITGTSTAAPPVRHASDMIWVGDWVPPPLLPTQQRAYLPVVVRNR
jgi:hypothetical protein